MFIAFSVIMVHGYCSCNIFDNLLKCHTLPCFSLKNRGQSFFLNHLFLPFNFRINRRFYLCKYSPPEKICGILVCKNEFCKNVYLPKYYIPLKIYIFLNIIFHSFNADSKICQYLLLHLKIKN